MRSSLLVLSLVLFATTAAQAQAPTVRDSAGIEIVGNAARSNAPARWQLGRPTVDLGGKSAPSESQFFTARSETGLLAAIPLRDGRILVADSWYETADSPLRTLLKYFSSSGELLSTVTVADAGEPFGGIVSICQSRGDTVLIAGAMIGVIDGAGRVVRRFPKNMFGGSGFADDACFADGSVLMPARDRSARLDFSNPDPLMAYVARRTDGTLAHSFGEQPYFTPLPPARKPSVVAAGRTLVVAPAYTSELLVYDLSNHLTRIIRWGDKPAAVTSAEMAASAGRPKASDDRGPLPPRDDPYTSNWPAYLRVLTDPTGRIWVEDEDHSAERQQSMMSTGWTAFDSTGRMVGRLLLPKADPGERRYSIEFGKDEVLIFHLNYLTKTGAKVTAYPMIPKSDTP